MALTRSIRVRVAGRAGPGLSQRPAIPEWLSLVVQATKKRGALIGRPACCLRAGPHFEIRRRRCLFLRRYDYAVAADRHDTEVIATVLLPAGFVVLGANRALLAVRDEVQAFCRNAVVNEVPLGACRTALAEGQVVLVRPTLVSVTLDTDPHTRVRLQPRDLAIECSSRIRSDRRLVEVEVDRASDRSSVDNCQRRLASWIGRQDVRVVLAHRRRRRWRRRRRRRNAIRARSRNALETGVRAHNLWTRTTQQEAQSAANMNVHVRAAFVIRHVIEHAIETQCGAVGDAETDTSKSARTVVVLVTDIVISGILELVACTSATRSDDELALPVHKAEQGEIVVETRCERVRIDLGNAVVGRDIVVLRRIVAIAFDFPPRIREEHSESSTVAESVLGNRNVLASGVAIEERPLRESAQFDGSRKWSIHLIPPNVRGPHHRICSCSTPEKVAQVGRELQTRLGAEVKLAGVRREVVQQAINTQRYAAEAEVEPRETVRAERVGRSAQVLVAAEVLQRGTSTDVNRRQIAEWAAVHKTRGDGARLHVSAWNANTLVIRDGRSLSRCVLAISLDVPVRRDERANAATIANGVSETRVHTPVAIEVRPLDEASYQQRTGRLCCRRSAEE